jgi:hypothetical protein
MELPSTSSLTNSCGDLCHETRVRLAASTCKTLSPRHLTIIYQPVYIYILLINQPSPRTTMFRCPHIHYSATRNKWVLLSAEAKETIHSFISVQYLKPEACISKSQSIPYQLSHRTVPQAMNYIQLLRQVTSTTSCIRCKLTMEPQDIGP